ncbi:MAG: hypothetical protein Q7S75_02345 [bacterium]|nr:hypothetical protein [bacterium]
MEDMSKAPIPSLVRVYLLVFVILISAIPTISNAASFASGYLSLVKEPCITSGVCDVEDKANIARAVAACFSGGFNNDTTCTDDDRAVLTSAQINTTANLRGAASLDPTNQKQSGGMCSGSWQNVISGFFNPVCWGRVIATVVSSILISVAAWALAIAGVLFNWSIMNSVILFKDVIFEPISKGINIGWTAFRDIANIVIIGVFTFIAISIILGNKEFGQKKLVARVLVIAILINFSLLFTKIIIDASNFTAGQFYAATQGNGKNLSQIIDAEKQARLTGVATAGSGVNPFKGYSQLGIAGQFVNFLGVTNVADTYASLREVGEQSDNGWLILVHALFAMILLLGAAIVLFYGSFLLISRAVILIFLLITSAIAFASHLIPKLSDGQYGWSAWWKSLLGSAVLAPLLMIFLYITLQIASNLKEPNGTLGNLISGSAVGGDINALFAYFLVLGLLFGSFKLASSFSSKIGGFNYAAMVPALGVGLGARLAGFAGRQTIGRVGTKIGEGFAERSKAAGPGFRGSMFDMAAQTFKRTGKRDFNVANTFLGKEVAGLAGLKGSLTGQTKAGGFEGDEKRRKERFAEKAGRMTYSDKELDEMKKNALKEASSGAEGLADRKEQASREYARLKTSIPAEKETKEAMIKALDEERKNADETKKKWGQMTGPQEASLRKKESEIGIQDQRIKAAEKRMSDYETKLTDIKKQEVGLEEQKLQAVEKALPKGSFDEKGDVKPFRTRLGDNATEVAHKRLTNLPWVLGGQKPEDDRIAKKMRAFVGDRETTRQLKKIFEVAEGTQTQAERHHRREERVAARTLEHEQRMEQKAEHGPENSARPDPGATGQH